MKQVLLVALFQLIQFVLSDHQFEPGCPPPENVYPCQCTNNPFTYLECEHIQNSNDLSRVFYWSTSHEFQEVHIKYSVLPYLPRYMFQSASVKALYLKNVTLCQLFDYVPERAEALETLHLESTQVMSGLMAWVFQPFTRLRVLTMYYNTIPILGPEQTSYMSTSIQQVSLYDTSTKYILPGTFKNHINIDKVAVDASRLTELSRDIFPVPFNGRYLYFNKNHLTTIPNDMFTNMPHLQTVGLKDNRIAVIPSTAFGRSWRNTLEYLFLEGNPLICDCRINWLIVRKPTVLSGQCSLPATAKGKQLKDLPDDYLLDRDECWI